MSSTTVRVIAYVRPYWRAYLCAVATSLGAAILAIAGPLTIRWLLDSVLPRRDAGLMVAAGGLLLISQWGQTALATSAAVRAAAITETLMLRLRRTLLGQVQKLGSGYEDSLPAGESIFTIETDTYTCAYAAGVLAISVSRAALTIVVVLAGMYFLAPILGIVAAIVALPLIALRRRCLVPLRAHTQRLQETAAKRHSMLTEIVPVVNQIALLGCGTRMRRRYVTLASSAARSAVERQQAESRYELVVATTVAAATAAMLALGGWLLGRGDLTVGSFVAFYGCIGKLFDPFSAIVDVDIKVERARASVQRLTSLLDRSPRVPVPPSIVVPRASTGRRLELHDVGFHYRGQAPILTSVSGTFTRGEPTALTGDSGVGKSTLAKLLVRSFDPVRGRIVLDGTDLRYLTQAQIRSLISLVPQEGALFDLSLRENLLLADPEASEDRLEGCASLAGLLPVVTRLAHGWNTSIGPGGAALSGGERQRIAIARAVLRNAPVLVLDESTSALDVPSETALMHKLMRWADDKILIVISHRPSIVQLIGRTLELGRSSQPRTAVSFDRDERLPQVIHG